ncbi:hypothetical protein THAOC_32339, partial [Thalassiosira oceanica]
ERRTEAVLVGEAAKRRSGEAGCLLGRDRCLLLLVGFAGVVPAPQTGSQGVGSGALLDGCKVWAVLPNFREERIHPKLTKGAQTVQHTAASREDRRSSRRGRSRRKDTRLTPRPRQGRADDIVRGPRRPSIARRSVARPVSRSSPLVFASVGRRRSPSRARWTGPLLPPARRATSDPPPRPAPLGGRRRGGARAGVSSDARRQQKVVRNVLRERGPRGAEIEAAQRQQRRGLDGLGPRRRLINRAADQLGPSEAVPRVTGKVFSDPSRPRRAAWRVGRGATGGKNTHCARQQHGRVDSGERRGLPIAGDVAAGDDSGTPTGGDSGPRDDGTARPERSKEGGRRAPGGQNTSHTRGRTLAILPLDSADGPTGPDRRRGGGQSPRLGPAPFRPRIASKVPA